MNLTLSVPVLNFALCLRTFSAIWNTPCLYVFGSDPKHQIFKTLRPSCAQIRSACCTVTCRCSSHLAVNWNCTKKKGKICGNDDLPPTPHTPLGVLEWNLTGPVLMSRTCLTLLCLALCWSCVYTSPVASSLLLPSSCVCGLVSDPLFFVCLFRPAVSSWEFLVCLNASYKTATRVSR